MNKKKISYFITLYIFVSINNLAGSFPLKVDYSNHFTHWQPYAPKHRDPFFVSFVKDMGLIVKNLFDFDSFKIISTTFPFFAAGCIVDDTLQNCFYDKSYHKNIHQLPSWTHNIADFCIYIPVAALGSLFVLGPSHDMRTAGRIFIAGLPFVWLGKDVIKQCKTDINLRPWNEHYSSSHRSYGGFPSGHMAASVYMTLFFGLRYGHAFSIPLGICSAFIGATYLSGNRHYLSQLIGGAAWGALWAYAARKVVDHDIEKDYQFNLGLNNLGHPELTVSCRF